MNYSNYLFSSQTHPAPKWTALRQIWTLLAMRHFRSWDTSIPGHPRPWSQRKVWLETISASRQVRPQSPLTSPLGPKTSLALKSLACFEAKVMLRHNFSQGWTSLKPILSRGLICLGPDLSKHFGARLVLWPDLSKRFMAGLDKGQCCLEAEIVSRPKVSGSC